MTWIAFEPATCAGLPLAKPGDCHECHACYSQAADSLSDRIAKIWAMSKKQEVEVEPLDRCSYNVATSKGDAMAADAIVRARVSEETKAEAAAIFEAAGLTTSDAIRMMLVRAVEEGALPFDPVKPNAKSVRAIKAARAGKVKKAKSSKQLLAKLNARA